MNIYHPIHERIQWSWTFLFLVWSAPVKERIRQKSIWIVVNALCTLINIPPAAGLDNCYQAGVLLAHDARSPGRDSLPRPAPSAPRYVSHHWLHGVLGIFYASPPLDLSDSSPAELDTCHLSSLAQEMPLELPRRVFDPVRHLQHRHAAGTNLMSRWTPGQECPPGAAAKGDVGPSWAIGQFTLTPTPAALLTPSHTD
jgi:hypothetical protein